MARLGLYQPFIEDRNVRRLYRLKVAFREQEGRRVPMTVLVNRILDDFFEADLGRPTRTAATSCPSGIETPPSGLAASDAI